MFQAIVTTHGPDGKPISVLVDGTTYEVHPGVKFIGMNLSGIYLSGANLSGSDLSGTDLSGAHLFNTNLERAVLRGVNFGAYLRADPCVTDLANPCVTDLRGTILKGASYNVQTQFPDGFDPKAAGMIFVEDEGKK